MKPALAVVPAAGEPRALADLAWALGLPGGVRLDGHDVHGRPRARCGDQSVPVSLARCGGFRAVALGRSGRVGVDLVDPAAALAATADLLDLASPGERAWILEAPGDPRRRLFELWACREALLKALGLGLALDPASVTFAPGPRVATLPGASTPPEGWRVETREVPGPGEGLLVAVAWTEA